MTDKAKRLGKTSVNSEIYFYQNNAASEECTFETRTFSGLNKREYFAAMAMQGLLTDTEITSLAEPARHAVIAADALLEELSKDE